MAMSDTRRADPHEATPDPGLSGPAAAVRAQVDADLAPERAKAADLDERLDKLEEEALPKPTHPAPIGGMIGT
jgi:hypothetical protein